MNSRASEEHGSGADTALEAATKNVELIRGSRGNYATWAEWRNEVTKAVREMERVARNTLSATDDAPGFEAQLRRLIESAVESAEQFDIDGEWGKDGIPANRSAYLLGYIIGQAQFSPAEHAALDSRIYAALSSSDTGVKP